MKKVAIAISLAVVSASLFAQSDDAANRAADALLVQSDTRLAKSLSEAALKADDNNTSAWFTLMEAAALEANDAEVIDYAINLLERDSDTADDPRVQIAAARLQQLAGNTNEFRKVRPRIQQLRGSSDVNGQLGLSLVAAAKDGAPELNLLEQSREYGLITDWKINGPYGKHPYLDFNRQWAPEHGGLLNSLKGFAAVAYQFPDGEVRLPDRMNRDGVYYSAGDFVLESSGEWRVRVQSRGTLQIFVDGNTVFTKDDREQPGPEVAFFSRRFDAGRHRVVVKFLRSAAPFSVAVLNPVAGPRRRNKLPNVKAGPEADYVNAALPYWNGDPVGAIEALSKLAARHGSASVQQLLGDAWDRVQPGTRRAREAYEAAAHAAPDTAAPQVALAQFAAADGDTRIAMVRLRRALSLQPGAYRAQLLFARLAAKLDWKTEAAEAFQRALRLHPACEAVNEARQFAAETQALRLPSSSPVCGPTDTSERENAAVRGRDPEFLSATEFFEPYRRDAAQVVRETSTKQYSGGPAVYLLNDRVISIADDGASSVYVHRLIRVLSRDGVVRYGEFFFPASARILELRTLRATGEVVEPELTPEKSTVSMAGLAVNDVVEEEYVVSLPPNHPDPLLTFPFGSFDAPIVLSRFAVITPGGLGAAIATSGRVPAGQETSSGARTIRTWQQNDISQSALEPYAPTDIAQVLPTIRVEPGGDRLDTVSERIAEALHGGPLVRETADQLVRPSTEETARSMYEYVEASIEPQQASAGSVSSAEEILASGRGDRAIALAALLRAAGIETSVVLARSFLQAAPADTIDSYSYLLLAVGTGEQSYLLDPDAGGFRAVRACLHGADGIVLSAVASMGLTQPGRLKLPGEDTPERSTAEADVRVNHDGSMSANVTIEMGSERGRQMRANLQKMDGVQRQHFFDQLAARIFPGASVTRSSVEGEEDFSTGPLKLMFECSAAQYLPAGRSQTVDVDQIVPSLGLRKMYGVLVQRRYPLAIDSVLFESAKFRVSLPDNITVAHLAPELRLDSEFGSYSANFRIIDKSHLEFTREFHVPMQLVAPEHYSAFLRFANRIDDLERQRITLAVKQSVPRVSRRREPSQAASLR